jgi:hypothetical protein
MRPPVCVICDEDIGENEGGLVYFKKRFSDRVWERKMERIEGVGHPPYAEWFCERHYLKAKELENLTIDKALNKIHEEERK